MTLRTDSRTRSSAIVVLVLVLALASSAPAAAQSSFAAQIDPARLRSTTDSFVVMMQGTARGWQRLRTARAADGWEVSDAVEITGMVQQQSVSRLGPDLMQRSLRQQGTMMNKPMEIALDFTGTRVRGRSMTPSSGPAGALTFDTTLAQGTIDDNTVAPLLATVRWRDSLTFTAPVFSSGKGTVDQYEFRVLGAESVTTPAGQFDTWRIEQRAGRSLVFVNVTRTAPYRVVRMSNGPAFEMLLVR